MLLLPSSRPFSYIAETYLVYFCHASSLLDTHNPNAIIRSYIDYSMDIFGQAEVLIFCRDVVEIIVCPSYLVGHSSPFCVLLMLALFESGLRI